MNQIGPDPVFRTANDRLKNCWASDWKTGGVAVDELPLAIATTPGSRKASCWFSSSGLSVVPVSG